MASNSSSRLRLLAACLALSGAAALCCEVVWMRRLALATGSTGVATTLTLATYMAGLGLGGLWGGRQRWVRSPGGYGVLELALGGWAIAFPFLLALVMRPLAAVGPGWLPWLAALLLLPPGFLAGATLPAIAAGLPRHRDVGLLYSVNTAGAVVGVVSGPALLFPTLGLRGTELCAAGISVLVGIAALALARRTLVERPGPGLEPPDEPPAPRAALVAAGVAGFAAMALEVVWTRLAALLVGSSVHAMAAVLAVFLAAVALGAWLGRRWPGAVAVRGGLVLMGLLAIAGTWTYAALPHGIAAAWTLLGEGSLLPGGVALLILAMAGAPAASGAVFTGALVLAGGDSAGAAGRVLAANTVGGVLGASLAGLLLMPWLGIQGVVEACALLALLVGLVLPLDPRPLHAAWWPRAALGALAVVAVLLAPRWDAPMYSVGLYHRVSEFVDLSPRAVDAYAHEGWQLRFYADGHSATVAVGQSDRSGNIWLSINGKVDASTGTDMATQQTSGWLPVQLATAARGRPVEHSVVVGLASGVTASAALEAGSQRVTVIELEPEVIRAARFFEGVNGGVLDDPRATVVAADARAWLARPGPRYPVIISEPSNPWITGVSNLFTLEYWQLARARLEPDGVFCQWVQLYSLPPEALRSLVATYLEVFPQAWLYETIPGADALLIAAPSVPDGLAIEPLLGPEQLRAFSAFAPLNTDDHPWVELEAPRWLHRPTAAMNRELLLEAAGP
jgi:spermidine synthase